MTTTVAQQVALDNALVPLENRVEIGKCNLRIHPAKTQKEPTYQVVLDTLALTTCYPAFFITTDIFQICPKLLNQEFDALPSDEEIVSFIKELGYKAATPKKARKFKEPDSPSTKRTLVTVEEGEPEPAKKVVSPKKPSRKQSPGVQIRDTPGSSIEKGSQKKQTGTSIHQAGGSSEGADFESEVPDEPKGKSIDISKGTSFKPGVLDVSKGDSFESEYKSWGDSNDEASVQDDEDVQDSDDEPQHADDERMDSKNQETNDDEEEIDDEFVHTPPNYVPTDDETNDVDEEDYDRIDKELYGDVNVEQTQEQTTGVQEESGQEMATPIPTPTTTEATTSTPFVLESETLNAIHLRLSDLEKEVKELKNVDYSLVLLSTIKSEVLNSIKDHLETSLDDALYNIIQKTQLILLRNNQKQQVPKETITSFDTTALEEFDQKTTLFETMTKSKSFNKILKNRALYHALMESNLEDEEAMDEGDVEVMKTLHEGLQSPRQST
ncbi:hypothetical protein Tco_0474967 [Tanacetum coccineum]